MSEPAAVMVPVAALKPWAGNPRKNDPAVDDVAASIKRFGFGAPIIARQENGEVIAGHTRLKAAIRLKLAAVPVRYLDLSAEEAHAYALADNKLGEKAEWDVAGLAKLSAELDLLALGWTGTEMDAITKELDEEDYGGMTNKERESNPDRTRVQLSLSISDSTIIEEAISKATELGMLRSDALVRICREWLGR